MKTLYLHVGTPKTATSSIQKFLSINRTLLKTYGYCFSIPQQQYPNIYSGRNAHFMTVIERHADGSRNYQAEAEILRKGLDHATHKFQAFDNLILSDESLWRASAYSRRKVFPTLAEDARQKGYQVKIIVYLRRQDDFLISLWNQRIKRNIPGHNTGSSFTFEERLEHSLQMELEMFNYASQLDRIAEIFGKENVLVRRFDPGSWVNQSIIDDFMNCIGLRVTDDFVFPEDPINERLSANATEIKRILNKEESFTVDESAYLEGVLRALSPDSAARYSCAMLSKEEDLALMARFEEQNRRVAEVYIGDGKPLFSDKVKDLPKWQPGNPYMLEDVIRLYASVFIDLRRENEQLQQELLAVNVKLSALQNDVLDIRKGTLHGILSFFIVRAKNWLHRIRRRNRTDTSV